MGKRIALPPPRTVSLADAVSEAFSEISSLAEEMREWADNMEEKFSATQKYETVSETADTLENISEVEVDTELSAVTVTLQDPKPQRRGYSRADRCAQACDILDACVSALEDYASTDDTNRTDAQAEAADELRNELDSAKSDAEGVEFPGMYG
jgi:hypothetical protein